MKKPITIENILHTRQDGISRISAQVAGETVWFESSDIELKPCAEGFASAFLVPALHKKRNIVINAAVDEQWLSNIYRAMKYFGKWWKYRRINVSATQGKIPPREKGDKAALCFSGGVDSFYSLLCSGYHIDYLVFIYGIDIFLKDDGRFNAYLPSLKAIAQGSGTRLIIIRTNIRDHNFFRLVSWERSHGSVSAAISHFIDDIGKLIISSTHSYQIKKPWGSHWKTDPLFSSSRVEIIHEGASVWRNQKIRSIADNTLVRKYLRVCWEQRNELLNCCQCGKCIITMLALEQCKKLDCSEAFPLKNNLLQYIEGMSYLRKVAIPFYDEFVYQGGFDPALERAIYALLKRSHKGARLFKYYLNYAIGYYKRK